MTRSLDLFKMDGKVVAITGGATGLGLTMAEAVAEAGADVAICGRGKHGSLEESQDKIEKTGQRCLTFQCDVTSEREVENFATNVYRFFDRCDVLIANAGVTWGESTKDMPLDKWKMVLDTNLTGAFLSAKAFGSRMIDRKTGGNILLISSVAALKGSQIGISGYCSSKAGLIGLTKQLAVEWISHGIRVNTLMPGWFPSYMSRHFTSDESPFREYLLELIPMKRFGTPDDLKGAILFLASDASSYMNGHALVLDGGLLSS